MSESGKTDLSVSVLAANFYSLLIVVPLTAMLWMVFLLLWNDQPRSAGSPGTGLRNLLVFLVVFLVGVVVHELIHAFGWMLFGRKPRRAVRFGIFWKTLTPYAHLLEPVEVNAYRSGTFLPGLLLGLLPALAAIFWGSTPLLAFGLLFTFAAGGDFLVLWLIRKVPAGRLVEDHPTRAGCLILDE